MNEKKMNNQNKAKTSNKTNACGGKCKNKISREENCK